MKIVKNIRIFTVLTALMLVLSILPMAAMAAGEVTVYLNPVSGLDTNAGTEAAPVLTVEKAYELLDGATEGTIIFLDTLTLDGEKRFPSHTIPVTLTSPDGSQGIASNNNVRFRGPTTLENMTMTLTAASAARSICGEGKKLTIGENVTSVDTDGYYFSLTGGARWAKCDSTDLTVKSGTWRNIYVGTYGYKSGSTVAGVTGNAKLTMTGGTLTGFISPMHQSGNTIGGDVEIYVENATMASLYCAPSSSGTVSGNVTVTLGKGAVVTGSVYAGGPNAGVVEGTSTIILDGADTTHYTRVSGSGSSDSTGSVGSSVLELKSGVMGVTPAGFTSVGINVAQEETLTISGCSVAADTVSCDGTLVFAGTGSLDAAAVTGNVSCTVQGELRNNHAYITAPAGSGFVFADHDVAEKDGIWIHEDLENFQGLVLTAAEDVTVTLYTGFADSTADTKVEPFCTEGNTKYYPNITGKYHYVASGTGYYTVHKNVYMSEEEAAARTLVDATPTKRAAAGGWEPTKVYILTDEVLTNILPSDKSLWPDYADVFTTPAFSEGRAAHYATTQQEMESFIEKLDDADDDMYVYSIGTSAYYEHDIPLVLFTATDLSGAKTLEEAAALVKDNGKPTIHYRAHMHGNEPAAGEAALAMIQRLDGIYGESVLDKVNIYVIPRLNPDGAQDDRRTLNNGIDPNRDLLRLRSSEMVQHHKVFLLFEPEVMLDAHEYSVGYQYSSITHTDILIAAGFSMQSNDAFQDMSVDIMQSAFAAVEAEDLSGYYYQRQVNGQDPNVSRGYVGNQGTLFFLMESRGITFGNSTYERRVTAHVVASSSVIDYVAENAQQVQKVVDDEKARIVTSGMTYEDSDKVILESDYTLHEDLAVDGHIYNLATGEKTASALEARVYDVAVRSRTAPTAYVIPAGESFTEEVLALMDKQGISYTQLPAGCVIDLQQYTGSATDAGLTEETAVTFQNGAYVFCMNQVRGTILSILMEPDVTDAATYKGTLAQQGILTASDGVFPLYRYIHDLNEDGSIDYLAAPEAPVELSVENAPAPGQTGAITGLDTNKLYEYRGERDAEYAAVPAGSTQITGLSAGRYYVRYQANATALASLDAQCVVSCDALTEYTVYLDPANGADTYDGLAESTAVQSVTQAYSQLSVILAGAPKGTSGKVVLLSDLRSTQAQLSFPEHDFPVILTSKTGAEQITHALSSASTGRQIVFNGPTTLENITVKQTGTSIYNYVAANGNKLIIGKNVTTLPSSNNYYFNVVGGCVDDACASADLTVLSGTWRNVYAGGYKGAVTGDVSLTMKDCTVTALIQNSYNAATGGNVTMDLENVTAKTIFGGNAYSADVGGDVAITLGTGVTAEAIYAGSRDKGNVGGTATIIVDGADLTDTPLSGQAKNTTGTVGKSILVLKSGTMGQYSGFDEVQQGSLRGDMNGDGEVTDADALYLLRHTLFSDRYPIDQSGDVNGDGQVTDADALYLLRFTLFPERYPLR